MSVESTEAASSSSCNMTALSRRSCSSSITLYSARLARRLSPVIFHSTRARLQGKTADHPAAFLAAQQRAGVDQLPGRGIRLKLGTI
ncbi:unnamed protein product [Sphagnum troendelagicum]|uniref:Uncharacterized protein n=1 Tax=Sphagnum troendelagicum TaxID=128251 RepID=A0ABP0U2B2_9BRYO